MTDKLNAHLRLGLLLLVTGLIAHSAAADGNAERGKSIAYTCLGCHGIEGYRNAYPSYRVPKLGGQKAAYLTIALQGYRNGTRQHPTMSAQAASLSDQDIADTTSYLASLGADTVAAGGTSGASFAAAAACAACHGQNGISLSPSWPSLAGQYEDYLVHALNQYRDGTRKDPVMAPMAATLTDDSVRQIAKYFAGLEGLETTAAE
ncbi:MAG: c-type cytochrome [Gammaproteobacteria bacterium]|nr:c-type cytochrome [Gammaproteobacteria bacterium]MDH5304301.1 c-type cytochrome [Gammaproteobacteria bacterium]MDH5322594.1 c-type cytochrome [Gammaproteobacteria bacterium]MDH5501520.1 c-type cytochrome [Gammaproteobacteria bacterium]